MNRHGDFLGLEQIITQVATREAGYQTLQDETAFTEDEAGYMDPQSAQPVPAYDALVVPTVPTGQRNILPLPLLPQVAPRKETINQPQAAPVYETLNLPQVPPRYETLNPSVAANGQSNILNDPPVDLPQAQAGNRNDYLIPVRTNPDQFFGSVRSVRSPPPAYEDIADIQLRADTGAGEYLSSGEVAIKKKRCPTYKCGFLAVLVLLAMSALGGIIYAIVDATQDDPYPRDPTFSVPKRTTTSPMMSSTTVVISTVTSSTYSTSISTTPGSTTPPPVNGEWSAWSEWSACSATCETGEQTRSRDCLDEWCAGTDTQGRVCTQDTGCAGQGQGDWSAWNSWSDCSESCATGSQSRIRTCIKDVTEDLDCPGHDNQEQDCNTFNCPTCDRCPGQGNPGCERCVCLGTPATGRVLSFANAPLSNVTVVDRDFPSYVLNTTDADGEFVIEDCCPGIFPEFGRADLITTFGEELGEFNTFYMDKIEQVVIIKEPENKVRKEGEDVTLCCEAHGNPSPDKYEWLKDGLLIEEGSGTLVRNNLQTDDSGYYQCIASNGYTTVRSQQVQLRVTESACSPYPASNVISLPQGCEQDGVGTLDVGKCPSVPCSGPSSGRPQQCEEEGSYCCMAKKVERLDLQCHAGFSLPVFMVRECGCSTCAYHSVMILGQVLASDTGQSISRPLVLINGTEIQFSADTEGRFTVTIPSNIPRLAITVEDKDYNFAETTKILQFPHNPTPILHVNIYLIPFFNHGNWEINEMEDVNLNIGNPEPFMHISIPAGSIYYQSGDMFTGKARIYTADIDPRNHSAMMISPGDYTSLTKTGEIELLKTFGMFLLKIFDDGTNMELQIAGKIRVNLIDSLSTPVDGDGTMMLLNRNSGFWEKSSFNEINNEIEVPLKTWIVWRGDVSNTCFAKVRLYLDNSFAEQNQLLGGTVRSVINDDKRNGGVASGLYAGVMSIRSSLDNGDASGFCILNICEYMTDPFTGYFLAEHEGRMLHPAIEGKDDIGMPKTVSDALQYDTCEDSFGIQSFRAKLTPSSIPANETGPVYNLHENKVATASSSCSNARYTDNHFRFYLHNVSDNMGPWPPYYVQEAVIQSVDSPPDPISRNWLAWFSESLENLYSVCFVKVYMENAVGLTIGATSQVGNCTYSHSKGNQVKRDDIYGIYQTRPRKDESLCLEVKHAMTLTDGQDSNPETCNDETHVTIGHFPREGGKNQCNVTEVKLELAYLLADKIISEGDRFEFYLDANNKGHLYGIYCAKDKASAVEARDSAWLMCAEGHDDHLVLKKPDTINNDHWAIQLTCN